MARATSIPTKPIKISSFGNSTKDSVSAATFKVCWSRKIHHCDLNNKEVAYDLPVHQHWARP